MSVLRSVGDVARGVSAELQSDLSDAIWVIIDILGLRGVVEGLLRELDDDASNSSNNVKKRSIIRIIGSALPLRPVPRPYLRYVALRSLSTSYDSLFSNNLAEADWKNNPHERFKSFSNNSIQFRPSTPLQSGFNTPVHSGFNGDFKWSDPSDTLSENASLKIAALEEELATLRSQIAAILSPAPERPLTPPSTPVPCQAPPPPPPPPPPPHQSGDSSHLLHRKSFSEMIAEKKGNINNHTEPVEVVPTRKISEGISMVEVLKGLNKVKLKRIDRSPGGTPIRERPRSPPPTDTASLIAAALKKRFANINGNSPEKDPDSTSGFSSPEWTPKAERKSRYDDYISEKKSSPVSDDLPAPPFILRKTQLTPKKPKPDKEKEQSSLPPFGQHLLKRRVRNPSSERTSLSWSEQSDLSR